VSVWRPAECASATSGASSASNAKWLDLSFGQQGAHNQTAALTTHLLSLSMTSSSPTAVVGVSAVPPTPRRPAYALPSLVFTSAAAAAALGLQRMQAAWARGQTSLQGAAA
jgi:hypothetical protein